MVYKHKDIAEKLIDRHIKPSFHRIKVLEYLMANRTHPTAEQIFACLKKELPTLSKATVYNTLKLFVEAKLAREITIEDKEIRYDYTIENHGHFKCESCGTIFDFKINVDDCITEELDDFVIKDKNVYFKGICPRCFSNT